MSKAPEMLGIFKIHESLCPQPSQFFDGSSRRGQSMVLPLRMKEKVMAGRGSSRVMVLIFFVK